VEIGIRLISINSIILKKIYTQLLAIMFVCVCLQASAQSIKKYVEQNAVPVKTVITTDSDDFVDLKNFSDAVGNSRIVMLGEQDHGDAPAFLAKTRLIKYLHEKKGFDVLAFESDFFALNYAWDGLQKDTSSIDSFLMRNIFPIWTVCDACENLFYHYLPSTFTTKNPLQVSGFDNQMALEYSWHHLNKTLDSFFRAKSFPVVKTKDYTYLMPMLDSLRKFAYLKDSARDLLRPKLDSVINYFAIVQQEADSILNKNDFWLQVINTYSAYLKEMKEGDFAVGNTIRDKQMAANLKWLCNIKYPDKKIIVWAASAHIQKGLDLPDKKFSFTNMGIALSEDSAFKNQTYILGFASATGTEGRLTMKSYKVARPLAKSFETWINNDYAYAFIDFSKFNRQYPTFNKPFYMKGTRHFYSKRVWNKAFDGIFFIRKMYPCKNILKKKI
jgi:erythromycin esterase-like protein